MLVPNKQRTLFIVQLFVFFAILLHQRSPGKCNRNKNLQGCQRKKAEKSPPNAVQKSRLSPKYGRQDEKRQRAGIKRPQDCTKNIQKEKICQLVDNKRNDRGCIVQVQKKLRI